MNRKQRFTVCLGMLTACLFLAGQSSAAIVVNNPSFENPGTGVTNNPNDWVEFNALGLQEGGINPITSDGSYWMLLAPGTTVQDNAASFHQQVDTEVQSGTYTVTFDVGDVSGIDPISFYVELWETAPFSGTEIGNVFFDPTPVTGTPGYAGITNGAVLTDLTAQITSTTTSSNSLWLLFSVDNGSGSETNEQIVIDDVRVTFTAIPEPASLALLSLGSVMLLRRRA